MDLGWETHFREIVLPAYREYLNADDRLTVAIKTGGDVDRARFDALREAGAAAFYLHHFSDIVLREPAPFLPGDCRKIKDLRNLLSEHCTMLRGKERCDDINLLADVVDALKHSVLTNRLDERQVASRDAVIVIGSGVDELSWGEGKYGGEEEVLVKTNGGLRAMSCVMSNVVDAWFRLIGWDLPDLNPEPEAELVSVVPEENSTSET